MFYVLFLLYALFVAPFVRAFVLKTLWGWFIVPVFGMPALGMAAAYGVGLVLHTFVGGSTPTPTPPGETPLEAKKRMTSAILTIVLSPIITLILGAVAHSCMGAG